MENEKWKMKKWKMLSNASCQKKSCQNQVVKKVVKHQLSKTSCQNKDCQKTVVKQSCQSVKNRGGKSVKKQVKSRFVVKTYFWECLGLVLMAGAVFSNVFKKNVFWKRRACHQKEGVTPHKCCNCRVFKNSNFWKTHTLQHFGASWP